MSKLSKLCSLKMNIHTNKSKVKQFVSCFDKLENRKMRENINFPQHSSTYSHVNLKTIKFLEN